MLKLSIITINLNNKNGLHKTMQSVFDQTFKDFEYIVIDGGSTDGSLEEIRNNEVRVNSWVSEKDYGIYNAMNKGILKANGKYLLFLNSGDYLLSSDVLEHVFRDNNDQDIFYGDILTTRNGKVIKGSALPDKITIDYMVYSTIMHPAAFIKRALFEKVGLYDENFKIASDYDFFLKALFKCNVSYKNLKREITFFEEGGVSSQNQEREMIQETYFGKDVVNLARDYHRLKMDYRALLKNKLVRIALKINKLFS